MKLFGITDIKGLLNVINDCAGRIELVTPDGDRLNLKSKLCQYVSLANLISSGEIEEMELVAYESEDVFKILEFVRG